MTPDRPLPTPTELEILTILWDRGPSTVAAVRDALAEEMETGYTTALKLLQIMYAKGLVTRDDSSRAHVYSAWSTRRDTQNQVVADLADRAFDGSAARLAIRALAISDPTVDELRTIRMVVGKLEQRLRETS